MVVQFLPIRLKNHLETLCTELEEENKLPKNSITSMKWLRNPDNWGVNQLKAHAILTLNSRCTANNIILSGVLIDGSQHDARKPEEDLKHCFKCQLIGAGHTAAKCEVEEACSNCAQKHPTGECRAMRAEFRCATCKKDGRKDDHTAWDRQCPAFIKEKVHLHNRKPENHYRFFPAEYKDRSRDQNARTQDNQCQSSRSQSRGRTSQQQPQKETLLRQRSLTPWMMQKDKTGEGSNRDNATAERRQNETEY